MPVVAIRCGILRYRDFWDAIQGAFLLEPHGEVFDAVCDALLGVEGRVLSRPPEKQFAVPVGPGIKVHVFCDQLTFMRIGNVGVVIRSDREIVFHGDNAGDRRIGARADRKIIAHDGGRQLHIHGLALQGRQIDRAHGYAGSRERDLPAAACWDKHGTGNRHIVVDRQVA